MPSSSADRSSDARWQHQPRRDSRGRHHADALGGRRRRLPAERWRARASAARRQVLGQAAGGEETSLRTDQDYLAWEVFGNRALRQGDWKLRWQYKPFGKGDWELFDIAIDPSEQNDLASQHPDRVRSLVALWDDYVKANGVILPSRSPFEGLVEKMPERFPWSPDIRL